MFQDVPSPAIPLARLRRQCEALDAASRVEALATGDIAHAARALVEIGAAAMGCERVNAWLFNDDATELHCIAAYEATPRRHSSGMVLHEADFHAEFQALKESKCVAADDARSDPRTAGYTDAYLKPNGITAMLDAMIHFSGGNFGLLCFEYVRVPHHWETDETTFACQLADKLALAILTQRHQEAFDLLRASEAALAEAQAIAHVGSWALDIERDTLVWSAETYRIFGLDPDACRPSYQAFFARVHPDDRETVESAYRASVEARQDFALDHRIVREDGAVRYVHERGRTFHNAQGRAIRSVGTVQDITERKHAEGELQFVNTLLTTEMDTSPDGVLVVDAQRRIISLNRRFADLWGAQFDRLLGTDDELMLRAGAAAVKDPDEFLARVQYLYDHPRASSQDDIELADGRFFERHTSGLHTSDGQYLGRVWFFRDITERKRAEARMLHTARHDALTGLANRVVFVEAVDQAIGRARRTGTGFAVLYLDLDHFKDVNDTLGHPVGDELLRLAAERLQHAVRGTDVIARFGGDEFAVIVSDIAGPMDAATLADALIRVLGDPFWVQGNEIRTGASIGVAVYDRSVTSAETLLAHADVALYRAKEEQRNAFRFFTAAMDAHVRTRVALRAELHRAIETNQLFLVYQPQVDALTGGVTGLEALVRWRHPELGVVGPQTFITIAEESGLMIPLGRWVMRQACGQVGDWLRAGLTVGRLAINVSATQFKAAADLESDLHAILEVTKLPPHLLELELTETVLMVASREHNDVLTRLRALGIRLAVDDFGTGYSSLDYLRRFPVDRIKIAQEFVGQVESVKGNAAIVKATIGLARELDISVIAEGVDSQDQLDLLKAWGCREAQGYYFSQPLHADEVPGFLSGERVLAGAEP
jgi:diguanylate cyclase (GGDEF)-like protein/PAS domain S-box-containing protein